jgi:hypothetical protein
MTITRNGKKLVRNGKAAAGLNCCCCCCEESPPCPQCCNTTADLLCVLASTDCPCLDGANITLVWDALNVRWDFYDVAYCGAFKSLEIWVYCEIVNGCQVYTIRITCGGSTTDATATTSCNPLSLVFNVVGLAGSACCNNVFNNVVTATVTLA